MRSQGKMDIREAEKLEYFGTMSAKVAHDLNNLLHLINGCSDLALDELSDPVSLEETINDIKAAALNGRKIVEQMRSFAKKTVTVMEPVRIDKIVADHVRILRSTVPGAIEIKLNMPDDLPAVFANPTDMTRILVNLSQNALQAMGSEGVLAISLSTCIVRSDDESKRYGAAPGCYVKLTVEDTGCGMTPKVRDKIFEPYFTTKRHEGGTGLGLAIINGIVKDHNGAISVKSAPGQGSVFDVYIPRSDQS